MLKTVLQVIQQLTKVMVLATLLFIGGISMPLAVGQNAMAAEPSAKGPVTGFDLPRFVSLQASDANLRTGPGLSYPIRFKYQRAHQPLQVIDEFGHWRKVKDWQGDEGWIHKRLLTGVRYLRVIEDDLALLKRPSAQARPRALLGAGTLLHLRKCTDAWCHVDIKSYSGWVPKAAVYGAARH